MKLSISFGNNKIYELGVILIIVSNICFFTMESLTVYLSLSFLGVLIIGTNLLLSTRKLYISACFIWLLANYAVFTFNGVLRLRYGTYNWDNMLFVLFQNIFLLIAFRSIFATSEYIESVKRIAIYSAVVCALYFLFNELPKLSSTLMRIGDSMSGDVNTVSSNMGVICMLLAFVFYIERNKFCLIMFVVLSAFSLLTGSKSALIYLLTALIFFTIVSSGKRRLRMILIAIIGVSVALYVIFNVKMFYGIIGYRGQDMIFQMFGAGKGHYSYSTQQRQMMIREGFELFLRNPIFGGGGNYFGAMTKTNYFYSHNNLIELLCNMGLVGAGIYYVPLINNFRVGLKNLKSRNALAILLVYILGTTFVTDWVHMTHSEPCVGYIPMILSFVLADRIKKEAAF